MSSDVQLYYDPHQVLSRNWNSRPDERSIAIHQQGPRSRACGVLSNIVLTLEPVYTIQMARGWRAVLVLAEFAVNTGFDAVKRVFELPSNKCRVGWFFNALDC